MPSFDKPSGWMASPLARKVRDDADARQIADATIALWQEIDDALTPIIGRPGAAALFRRSLQVASADHPWLAGGRDSGMAVLEPAALKALFSQQSDAEAAAGGSAFLQTCHELLANLIGLSLTQQLLLAIWPPTRAA